MGTDTLPLIKVTFFQYSDEFRFLKCRTLKALKKKKVLYQSLLPERYPVWLTQFYELRW